MHELILLEFVQLSLFINQCLKLHNMFKKTNKYLIFAFGFLRGRCPVTEIPYFYFWEEKKPHKMKPKYWWHNQWPASTLVAAGWGKIISISCLWLDFIIINSCYHLDMVSNLWLTWRNVFGCASSGSCWCPKLWDYCRNAVHCPC